MSRDNETLRSDLAGFQNRARQIAEHNICSIIYGAASDIGIPTENLLKGLDPGWMSRFLAEAGLVDKNELQAIWSMLLKNEAYRPGSVSYRTLSTLADWELHDLKVFTRVAPLALESSASFFLPADLELLSEFGISMADLLTLEEAGVLRAERLMQPVSFTSETDGYVRNKTVVGFIGTKDRTVGSVHLMECIFTSAGKQLLQAIPAESNSEFLLLYLEHIADSHPDLRVSAHAVLQSGIEDESTEANYGSMKLEISFDKHDLLDDRKQEKAGTTEVPGLPGIAEKMRIVKSLQGRITCNPDSAEERNARSTAL